MIVAVRHGSASPFMGEALGLDDADAVLERGLAGGHVDDEFAKGALPVFPATVLQRESISRARSSIATLKVVSIGVASPR